jgi:enoyl-CoA hydratase/carnithine racemase
MSDAPRLIQERHGEVLKLAISNPAARNALHPDIYREGVAAMRAATDDPSVAAIVLCGDGDMFCSGGNLQGILERRAQPEHVQHRSIGLLHTWVPLIRECPKPVIAAVEGAAAGAGMAIALACDLLVVAEDAKFTMAYVKVGLSPDGGGSWQLAQRLPRQLALELMFEGGVIGPERLHALGMANRVVPKGTAVAEAMAWAGRIIQLPRGSLASIKRLADAAEQNTLRTHLDLEREHFVRNQRGADCEEGIKAFFEKRKPQFNRA